MRVSHCVGVAALMAGLLCAPSAASARTPSLSPAGSAATRFAGFVEVRSKKEIRAERRAARKAKREARREERKRRREARRDAR